MTTHEAVVALYELSLEQMKREIQDYPESHPKNAVIAKDIAFTERKLAAIRKWNDVTYPRLVERMKEE